jgi:hypothetical protein
MGAGNCQVVSIQTIPARDPGRDASKTGAGAEIDGPNGHGTRLSLAFRRCDGVPRITICE